ncbi:Uncharacterised protein [Serratia ficaria]|uniref:Uncharacterized protein n=1 Tax=Serratia ficaria TaxID=61651 RepID=A0A240CCD5_SERFI|nr:hypothetical protein C7332_0306 [Serratia ficaria]CAI1172763.1 Uncharacterised protein [Serratia ficaria]CAI1180231.1 Uncharacterised protein [Serratia ficaria]CAI1201954.1 Uncharacterised protein [Serratia ficaria]CAI2102336.1 Uncharacterised protein [Serratia ficaria]
MPGLSSFLPAVFSTFGSRYGGDSVILGKVSPSLPVPQLVTGGEYYVDVALEGAMTRGMPERRVDNARLLTPSGETLARG